METKMEALGNTSVVLSKDEISTLGDKDLQELIGQLQDAVSDAKNQLQRAKHEKEQADDDLKDLTEELNRRMIMVLKTEDGLCDALTELDGLVQHRQNLTNELKDVELDILRTRESRDRYQNDLQREEAKLLEEENSLKVQCQLLRMKIGDRQTDDGTGEEIPKNHPPGRTEQKQDTDGRQKQVKTSITDNQGQTTVKPKRNRRMQK